MLRTSSDDISNVLKTNLEGPMNMSRVLLRFALGLVLVHALGPYILYLSRGMLSQRAGSIVNIGSVVGLNGNAGQCAYSASK